MEFFSFLVWLGMVLFTISYAKSLNRSQVGWFLCAILLTPVFSLVALWILDDSVIDSTSKTKYNNIKSSIIYMYVSYPHVFEKDKAATNMYELLMDEDDDNPDYSKLDKMECLSNIMSYKAAKSF